MAIRKIGPEEAGIVKQLAQATWPDTFRDILKPEQIEYMLSWMYNEDTLKSQMSSGHHFFLFEKNGCPLGFMGVQPDHPERGTMKIHKLYVLPETQGMGIGRQFIRHASDLGRSLGMKKITLNVNRFNKAVQFYEHTGFVITREENIDIGNSYWMEDFVMDLSL